MNRGWDPVAVLGKVFPKLDGGDVALVIDVANDMNIDSTIADNSTRLLCLLAIAGAVDKVRSIEAGLDGPEKLGSEFASALRELGGEDILPDCSCGGERCELCKGKSVRPVTKEEWEEAKKRSGPGENHPCGHWIPELCGCRGACSCHWTSDVSKINNH